MPTAGPIVLCVLDGIGTRPAEPGDPPTDDAVAKANTPNLDRLTAAYPHTTLTTSGPLASSAQSHVMLGAGRPISSPRTAVDNVITKRKLGLNEVVDQTIRICLYDKCRLHLFGTLSSRDTHGSMKHAYELLEIAAFNDIKAVLHLFLDGGSGRPREALRLMDKVDVNIDGTGAIIGTISGGHWALDRDGNWDRTYKAFHAIVRDKELGASAPEEDNHFECISTSYSKQIDDAFILPTRLGDYKGFAGDYLCDFSGTGAAQWEWTGEECGFAFNFHGDRMRQLSAMLTRKNLPDEVADDILMDRQYSIRGFRKHCYVTLTSYDPALELPVAFASEPIEDTFAAIIAKAGKQQLRISETLRTAHVTRYFNGHREEPHPGETHQLVPSSKLIDHHDESPEMKSAKIAKASLAAIETGAHDFILINFPNADIIAHTGKMDATVAAIESVDAALGPIADATIAKGGTIVITGSHGNAENLTDAAGKPNTAHTDNPVPLIIASADLSTEAPSLRDTGTLADVAPTLLNLLDLPHPESMTGSPLLEQEDGG